jgi:DMSO/TMAO reductase YedYZ molybdopterin-dependent catalytic subunit
VRVILRRGALLGAIVTAPFVTISYVGWRVFGWPFLPFDLFDWIVRALPGAVVTFAIDLAVTVSSVLPLGTTANSAKTADQVMAIALVFVGGGVIGAALALMLRVSDESARTAGVMLGALLGGLAWLLESDLQRLPPGSFVSGAWVVSTVVGWGLVFGTLYERVREDSAEAVAQVASAERRQFLVRTGGIAAASSLAGALLTRLAGGGGPLPGERWSASHTLPNAGSLVTPLPGTRPEFTPLERHYRIDVDTRAPVLRERDWRLRVGGLVDHPLVLTLDDIRSDVPLHQFITLECISNPVGGDLIGTTRWTGLSLQRVLARVQRGPRATHVRVTSADGFFETVALELIDRDPRVMLTYAWDGVPLFLEHGFPLRLYVPNVYGMKQPKWITAIDILDHFEAGYWVSRGWDREGTMKATSAIDTVVAAETPISDAGRGAVSVGGIAHAGARPIARVEVRVDDGAWHEAVVREPMSSTAWVVWRAQVPYAAGEHTFTVRCVEREGAAQTEPLYRKRITLPPA